MNRDNKRRGAVLVFTVIVLMVLIGFMGLSIDWGKLALNVHQLQNAADAAALAGAERLGTSGDQTEVIARAAAVALQNQAEQKAVVLRETAQPAEFDGTDESPYDVILGRYYPQFRGTVNEWEPNVSTPNAVKAFARREDAASETSPPLAMLFGPIFGVGKVETHRSAMAMVINRNGAGLICLYPYDELPGIDISNNTNLIIKNGDVQVNSDAALSVLTGSATLECLGLNTCGTVDDPTKYDFPLLENAPRMKDPLELVPDFGSMPAYGTALEWNGSGYVPATDAKGKTLDVSSTTITSNEVTKYGGPDEHDATVSAMLKLTPGYYPKGFNLSSTGTKLLLSPGVYAVGGDNGQPSGLVVNGGKFIAEGVMIYMTHDESNISVWGQIRLNGDKAEIRISEYVWDATSGDPAAYRVYGEAGLAIFQDRTRLEYSNDQPFFAGGAKSSFEGTVYLHTQNWGTVPYISGGAGSIGIQVITDRLELGGGGTVLIDYDGRNHKTKAQPFIVR